MVTKLHRLILVTLGNADFLADVRKLSEDVLALTRGLHGYEVVFDWSVKAELTNEQLMQEFDIAQEVNNYNCDEVWVFGSSEASVSMGGTNAFWLGTVPVKSFEHIHRRFPFLRFGSELLLKTYARRVENTMYHVYRGYPPAKNMWEKFIRSQPDEASCGSLLYPPNGVMEGYDSTTVFLSDADDWLRYPNFRNGFRFMDSSEWGATETGYIKWWLRHIPHGEHKTDGIHDNWWSYVMNLDLVR
jgi:hypothetical protein